MVISRCLPTYHHDKLDASKNPPFHDSIIQSPGDLREAADAGTGRALDIDERYLRLSEAGDPLEKLNAVVPWEVFASHWPRR